MQPGTSRHVPLQLPEGFGHGLEAMDRRVGKALDIRDGVLTDVAADVEHHLDAQARQPRRDVVQEVDAAR
jgi:hypothetical protein